MKAVTVYRPNVLENALSEFDRYMESFFGESFLTPSDRIFGRTTGTPRLPSVDVRENDTAYILEAELPGYDEKDIQIRVDSNCLTIESKKTEESSSKAESPSEEGNGGSFLIQERRSSSFSRAFKLPENADTEGITAVFKNGILSLEIKKKEEAQKRIIQITKS